MSQTEEDRLEILKLALDEGRQGLADQDLTIKSIWQRAMWIGGLSGVVAAFLGREALEACPLSKLALNLQSAALVLGFLSLFVAYAAVINTLRPRKGLNFHNSPTNVINQFTSPDNPVTLAQTYEVLANFSQDNYKSNEPVLRGLFSSLMVAAAALFVEFVSWIVVLA